MPLWELVTGQTTLKELTANAKPTVLKDPADPDDGKSPEEQFLTSLTRPRRTGPFCRSRGIADNGHESDKD